MSKTLASSAQHPIAGAFFKGIIWVFAKLPFTLNRRLGRALGWLLWQLPNSTKRTTQTNLAIAYPDLSRAARDDLAKKSLAQLGKTVTELGPLWLWPKQKLLPLIKEVRGLAQLEAGLAQGRGVIVLSPHLGAWELMGWYWSVQYGITSLYRPPRMASIETFMRTVRERAGAHLVPTDMSGVKALRRALKNQQIVGILPDQDPGASGGVIAPFFNQPANTMLLVAKLAQKAQCPVFYTFAERLAGAEGYRIHVMPALDEVSSGDEFVAAKALNQGVERALSICPSQYQWSYKRYKNVPGQKVY
ncbi:lipid A biosynthesis acyltransferase [Thiomicrospira sp. R3]|uniref:lysophospholipid acyltransferase family protein n=1 Tax=Thiomicrospira sp. R3 TaxID=3035472 RepID=UPI00259B0C6F|nr:lipid A biosynthesis acyltransferase [Thiomicrospira sp. R3]WFE69400.1 lipid A biosynthesis acyltransferase [Thiomicrospira sp. R3]